MPEERAPAFVAWMDAETAAYTAIHQLYQRTQGGRLDAPSHWIEQIARLRKVAELRFVSLEGNPDEPPQRQAVVTPQARRERRRPFEVLSRTPAEQRGKRDGSAVQLARQPERLGR